MKTSKLIGPALDWAVAKCLGLQIKFMSPGSVHAADHDYFGSWGWHYFCCTTWSQGGPIIEREKISVVEGMDDEWQAGKRPFKFYYGPTPLIAAMRCYVASKLGDEVEIPEELK